MIYHRGGGGGARVWRRDKSSQEIINFFILLVSPKEYKGKGGGWVTKKNYWSTNSQYGGGGGGWVVKTNWQNLLGGLIKFLSWHNWSPLTLPSHPTQATNDDRSLKKVRECRGRGGFFWTSLRQPVWLCADRLSLSFSIRLHARCRTGYLKGLIPPPFLAQCALGPLFCD